MRLGRGFAVIVLAVLALSMTPVLASAQTTPDPTPTTDPSATPTPTPDPTTTPSPTDDPTPSDSPTSDPSPTGDPSPSSDPGQRQHPGGLLSVAAPGLGGRIGADARKGPRSRGGRDGAWAPNPKWGAYSTQRLVVAERRLERHGMPERKALDAAFAPFPVGGLAVWSDTWGAPRYAGGYHPHHGQDLLCAEGTPLLAVQPGVVEFGSDPLGGTTIELTLRDGSFWYYAHLDHYAKGLTDGEHVSTGQVIGALRPERRRDRAAPALLVLHRERRRAEPDALPGSVAEPGRTARGRHPVHAGTPAAARADDRRARAARP